MAIQHITDFQQGMMESIEKANGTGLPVLFSHVAHLPVENLLHAYSSCESLYKGERFFWRNPEKDLIFAGIGSACKYHSFTSGSKRFKEMKSNWAKQCENTLQSGLLNIDGTGAITFGGFSFDSNTVKPLSLWEHYGAYLFFVPKFLLTQTGDQTYITSTMIVDPDMDADIVHSYSEERERMIQTVRGRLKSIVIPQIANQVEPGVADWKHAVQNTINDIQRDEVEKVVLARHMQVNFNEGLPADVVLYNLSEQQQSSFIFSLESASESFVGATPERLVKKHSTQVFSACLAGSTPRGKTKEEDIVLEQELLKDTKNLAEHQYVVQMISEDLSTVCTKITMPDQPTVMKNRHIQHLYTPVEGTCTRETSILDMVEALHPTPAMGGSPREKAIEKINHYEQFDRGLYAAPIGWMDTKGNGDFAVAIRSALLKSNQACLFAGCGIVEDSTPESEYSETLTKFKPMLSALGGVYE